MLPNFIGIGAPKAATTWIYECLKEHPDVYVTPIKETNFFAYYDPIDNRMDQYEDHFRSYTSQRAVGEISTVYFSSELAPERIRKHIPDVKLLLSLRNPIDQIYSHYWHLKSQNFHEWEGKNLPVSFEDALERYQDRLLGDALYHKNLLKWLEFFDLSDLKIIFYEDIKNDPVKVISEIYQYIDVDPGFIPESINRRGTAVREGRSAKNETYENIYKIIYEKLNVHVYHRLKITIGNKRAIYIKEKIGIKKLLNNIFFKSGYPEMSSETRTGLRRILDQDIKSLEKLLNRDLSNWK